MHGFRLVLTIAGAQSFPRSQGSLFSNVANSMSQTQPNKCGLTVTLLGLQRGYSSVVEHLTADQEAPGSNPGAPSFSR